MYPKETRTGKQHIGKGFVYMLLVQRASEKISKLFKNVMKQAHNEYVSVRRRDDDAS